MSTCHDCARLAEVEREMHETARLLEEACRGRDVWMRRARLAEQDAARLAGALDEALGVIRALRKWPEDERLAIYPADLFVPKGREEALAAHEERTGGAR